MLRPMDNKELKDKADDSVCAVMIELIQGEGGVLPWIKNMCSRQLSFAE